MMVSKSIEAFVLGLEIYNKPTIKYRIEGFSFFICNAWELLLKARLLQLNESIYFIDNPDRTIPLTEALRKVYPDKNTKLRLNLEKVIELRNISTHYITEDYEVKYASLFQACVLNFVNEMERFFKKDVTDYIAQNFLTLSAHLKPLSNEEIEIKYPPEIAEKLIKQGNEIDVLTEEYDSDKFAINIKQNLYITKSKGDADFLVKLEESAEVGITIAKELKDPANTHKYSYANVITAVQERMKKNHLRIDYKKGFNTHVMKLFVDFYDIKKDKKYTYRHKIGNNISYTYSQLLVEFIIDCIKANQNTFFRSLKHHQEQKKITPGT